MNYLTDNLKSWADHEAMITDHANESYYLPDLKRKMFKSSAADLKKLAHF